jgi:hypothetical protein
MTTATEQLLDRKIQEQREKVQQAIARGGLPTEAEILEVEAALANAYNAVEALSFRVEGIAEIENCHDDDLSYTVTLEQIGLVAAFTADLLDLEIPQLQQEAGRLRGAIGPLGSIQRNQQARSAA